MYGRKTKQFCDSVSTERKIVRTEVEPFVVWLVRKEKLYGQKIEPFCDLVGTKAKHFRAGSRTNL